MHLEVDVDFAHVRLDGGVEAHAAVGDVVAAAVERLLAFGVQAWRQRRDVWVPMHSACMFQPGDEIKLNGTAGPAGRARVLKVTRSALLVRPIK